MRSTLALLSLFTLSSAALADNFDPAQFLQKNCSSCHGTEVYTRDQRRVQSMDQLKKQLARCEHATGATLSDADSAKLLDYMNSHYYKF